MPDTNIDWISTLGILAAGLVIGAFFVARLMRSGSKEPAPAVPPLVVRDLLAKRDALILQLRELEDTRSKLTPEQLAHERYSLEIDTARVMAEIAQTESASATSKKKAKGAAVEPSTPAAAVPAGSSAMKGFAWGVASVVVVGLVVAFAFKATEERDPNGIVTGGLPGQARAAVTPEMTALQEAIRRNPDDFEARLELARTSLMSENMMEVFEQTQYVLQRQPENARALSYQALVRLAMGEGEVALSMLRRATVSDPDLLDGWIHLALALLQLGQPEEAAGAISAAIERRPDQRAALESLFAEMNRAMAAAPHGDMGGAAQAAPHATGQPVAGGGAPVSVTLDIDPALAPRIRPGSAIYVIARAAGTPQGPPLAVRRLESGNFPLTVAIGGGDSMTGEVLPQLVRIEARIDADGDAMTRGPEDINALADNVAAGSSTTLVFRR
jgi:cytochrome c-type biogenesis protein CcmH